MDSDRRYGPPPSSSAAVRMDDTYLRTIPEDRSDAGESTSTNHSNYHRGVVTTLRIPIMERHLADSEVSLDSNSSTGGVVDAHQRSVSVVADAGAIRTDGNKENDNDDLESAHGDGILKRRGRKRRVKSRRRRPHFDPVTSSLYNNICSGTMLAGIGRSILALEPCKPNKWTRRTKLLSGVAFFSILLIALTIILVIELAPRDSAPPNPPSLPPMNSSVLTPTFAPFTAAPSETVDPFTAINSVVNNISSASDLMDISKPQYKARQWMLYDDFLQLDVVMAGRERIAQRYIIAEFFFALWTQNDTTLLISDQDDEIEDNNKNENILVGDNSSLVKISNNRSGSLHHADFPVPIPLEADKSECDWSGISCDPESSSVTKIILPNSAMKGTLPQELANLAELRRLSLSNNSISGTIPLFLSNSFGFLETLDLSHNKMTGTIPYFIWHISDLRNLYLSQNDFTGSVELWPPANDTTNVTFSDDLWSSILEDIRLDDNNLTGSLLTEWGEQDSLQKLILSMNAFTGSVPQNLAHPLNLTYLDLSFNRLTGSVDDILTTSENISLYKNESDSVESFSFGPSKALTHLYLNNNRFSGTLPGSTTNTSFFQVWLQNNQFSGMLPETFGSGWTFLYDLRLENNTELTVVIDLNHCQDWPYITDLQADCGNASLSSNTANDQNDTTTAMCACCTKCF